VKTSSVNAGFGDVASSALALDVLGCDIDLNMRLSARLPGKTLPFVKREWNRLFLVLDSLIGLCDGERDSLRVGVYQQLKKLKY
jgi:hypothetical protein